jgi:hypothetical protein
MKSNLVIAPCLCALLLSGCGSDVTTTVGGVRAVSSAPPPQLATFQWRLPRTVLDVDVTLQPLGCDGRDFKVKVTPQVTPRAKPDDRIGNGGWITLKPDKLQSFWADNSFTFKTIPSTGGLVQSVGSTSTSEVGQIISNTVSGVVKIAAAAFGVPVVAPAVPAALLQKQSSCGMATAVQSALDRITAYKKAALGASAEAAQKYATQIQALQDSITIHVKTTIDPGVTSPDTKSTAEVLIFLEAPKRTDIVKAWLPDDKKDQVDALLARVTTEIRLDFGKAQPSCGDSATPCTQETGPISDGTLYREARYIPVSIVTAAPAAADGAASDPQNVPFGQFGVARTLPIEAKAFKNITWEVDMTSFGEVSGATFGAKSTGAAISSSFASAAGAANAIASEQRASVIAVPAETTQMQNRAAALKAQVDVATYQTQLNALKLQAGSKDDQ